MKKILIFEPESTQAQAISKYIKKHSNYYLVGCTETKKRFNKKNYDEIIVKNFEGMDETEYAYILPTGANSSFRVIKKHKKLVFCNEVTVSSANLVVYDKPKMLDIADNLNVPIPKTFYNKNTIDDFPIFYKENFEKGGGTRGVAYKKKDIPQNQGLIYQEFIDTPSTYGVGFLAKKGEVLVHKTHKEVISHPVDGGSSVVIENFDDQRIIRYTQKLVKELGYSGWGLSEFKYCKTRKDFVFMEINGKLWASVEFMFINDQKFLNFILDINYEVKPTERLVFINRLFRYTLVDIIKHAPFIFCSKIIKESSLSFQIVRKITPDWIVVIIKKLQLKDLSTKKPT